MDREVYEVLRGVVHPETGIEVECRDRMVEVVLRFAKARDPLAKSVVRRVEAILRERFAQHEIHVAAVEPDVQQRDEAPSGAAKIKKVIAVVSGKGGVGKSTVSSNLAVTLAGMGYKVGLLDADIYGPSQPKVFGVEGFTPMAETNGDGVDMIGPAEAHGVKVMSIGFFIPPGDALIWRGPMATSALRQMIHQTEWGELDYLLIDLPPGTGDVHLTVLQQMRVDGAVVVSTPQQIALEDVRRGVSMLRSPKVAIPILGVIENMAWFTPEELPQNRYYIFGRGGARRMAEGEGLDLLGEIPVIQSVMAGMECGTPGVELSPLAGKYYVDIAEKIVGKLRGKC